MTSVCVRTSPKAHNRPVRWGSINAISQVRNLCTDLRSFTLLSSYCFHKRSFTRAVSGAFGDALWKYLIEVTEETLVLTENLNKSAWTRLEENTSRLRSATRARGLGREGGKERALRDPTASLSSKESMRRGDSQKDTKIPHPACHVQSPHTEGPTPYENPQDKSVSVRRLERSESHPNPVSS